MILNQIIDPRDNLEKATRDELLQFAQARGVKEIDWQMPGILMRKILRQKGVTDIPVRRVLGFPPGALAEQAAPSGNSVNADDAIEAAYMAQKELAEKPVQISDASTMSIQELRKECKARGIKLDRRDNLKTLRAKLNGEAAS